MKHEARRWRRRGAYHDHLKIFWEKETLEYMKSLRCKPNDPNDTRTWYDRLIKLEESYATKFNVSSRYWLKLMGDSPELMALDCHLFADIKEGVSRNIAVTYFLNDKDDRKYLATTPAKLYAAIKRTIQAGVPTQERIIQDCTRIVDETIQRIIDAKGCYIDDSIGIRHGQRKQLARNTFEDQQAKKEKRQSLGCAKEAEKALYEMIDSVLQSKSYVPFQQEQSQGGDQQEVGVHKDDEDENENELHDDSEVFDKQAEHIVAVADAFPGTCYETDDDDDDDDDDGDDDELIENDINNEFGNK